jgi:hypothetical protein
MTKATKRNTNTVTLPTRTVDQIARDIVSSLSGIADAKGKASGYYKEVATILDAVNMNWTAIKWNRVKSADSLLAVLAEAGVGIKGKQIAEIRTAIITPIKEARPNDVKTAWQGICRWSAGYTGSAPLHPDVKAEQADAKAKEGFKGNKEKKETSNEEPIVDTIAKNPQYARKVLSFIIAGLMENKAIRKANKVSTASLDAAISVLEDGAEALAALK